MRRGSSGNVSAPFSLSSSTLLVPMSVYATANRPTASSYSSRYADDDLDSEEEEEERRLSEQYGEAGDDSGGTGAARSNKNKRQANTHMTEEDAAAAKEFEEQVRAKKKNKKQTTTLEPIHLKSAKGLIYIRRSFPTQVAKYRHPKNGVSSLSSKTIAGSSSNRSAKLAQKIAITSQINAAASYSRNLISAYHDFARELLPTLAPEDVYLKIEDLGSKKEIRDYLQLMRDEFRKVYLTKIYGAEKAERILNELEYGLRSSAMITEHQQQQKYDDYDERTNVVPRLGYAVTNDDDDDDDIGAEYFGKGVAATHSSTTRVATNEATASFNDEATPTSSSLVQERLVASNDDLAASTRDNLDMPRTDIDKDDDDDEEATFEEDDTVTETAKAAIGVYDTEKEEEENEVEEEVTIPEIEMDGSVLPIEDIDMQVDDENKKLEVSQTVVDCDKTQETLTLLMESQIDDYSQDEPFSQVGNEEMAHVLVVVAPTQTDMIVNDDGSHQSQQDDGFSQTQDSRFSQTQGVMFEEDVSGNNNVDEDEGVHPPCFELGQTETY